MAAACFVIHNPQLAVRIFIQAVDHAAHANLFLTDLDLERRKILDPKGLLIRKRCPAVGFFPQDLDRPF